MHTLTVSHQLCISVFLFNYQFSVLNIMINLMWLLDKLMQYFLKAKFHFSKDQFADLLLIVGIAGAFSQVCSSMCCLGLPSQLHCFFEGAIRRRLIGSHDANEKGTGWSPGPSAYLASLLVHPYMHSYTHKCTRKPHVYVHTYVHMHIYMNPAFIYVCICI